MAASDFHIKMPVAVEQDRAVFTYIDPGMGTPTELQSCGAAHQPLWQILRESGRRVEVVAVAWEQHLLERAERVFTSWRGQAVTDAEQEILMLRQAIDEADWETLEPYGGLDAAMRTLHQFEQQNPNFNGPGMIDDFHLWGSRRCRQMGVTLLDGGVTLKGDMLLTTTTLLSQRAEPSPLWSETLPKRRTGRGMTRISHVRYEEAMRVFASRVPLPRAA